MPEAIHDVLDLDDVMDLPPLEEWPSPIDDTEIEPTSPPVPIESPAVRSGPRIPTFSLKQLMSEEMPEVRWAVTGLLPEGLTLLAGKPKMGKSWLAFQLAIAVASGSPALGSLAVIPGEVLYLALEDTRRRLQQRAAKLLTGGAEIPDGLELATTLPRFDGGGLAHLTQWLDEHPDARLVIIDTLARVRPARSRGENVYTEDYGAMEGLKALSDARRVAILVVHHLRKAEADDPMDMVSGSTGLTGGVDNVLVLQRVRGKAEATLSTFGRDLGDQSLALAWDADAATWSLVGTAQEERVEDVLSEQRTEILRLLGDARTPLGPKEVSDALGRSYGATKVLLWKMAKTGSIRSTGAGQYAVWNGRVADPPGPLS